MVVYFSFGHLATEFVHLLPTNLCGFVSEGNMVETTHRRPPIQTSVAQFQWAPLGVANLTGQLAG